MRCVYINLDASAERRAALEANFNRFRRPRWRLERFSAVAAASPDVAAVEGRATPAEKACYLSHKRLIEGGRSETGPLMVMEDDVAFGPSTCGAVERAIVQMAASDWDILFTSVCIPDFNRWIDLLKMYRDYKANGNLRYFSLRHINFASAAAYIVSERAKEKLINLLSQDVIDAPIDVRFRQLINRDELTGVALCPFATSLSPLADASTLRSENGSADAIWNLFQRLFCVDRDEAACRNEIARLASVSDDEEAALFAPLFAAALSGRFIFR